MAQIDTSANCPLRNSSPPAPRSPAIVSSSGRPAATRVPKAKSSSASVSGQDSISDLSIAALFAALKSDHIAAVPVRRTATPGADRRATRSFEPPGRLDHLVRRRAREPDHDRRAAVGRDRVHEDVRDGRVAAEHCSHAREGRLVRARTRTGDDHGQRVGAAAGEVGLERVAGLHGLRAESLPAGARKRPVRERRERAEHQHDRAPCDRDGDGVIGRPRAQAPQPSVRDDGCVLLHRLAPGVRFARSAQPCGCTPVGRW